MDRSRFGIFLVVLMFSCSIANGQNMARLEEIGELPHSIEAEGFLMEKFGQFYDQVGKYRQNKTRSAIFAGSRIVLRTIDDKTIPKRPSAYYYKIVDHTGKDLSVAVNQALNKSKALKSEFLPSSNILIDTNLSVSDYLFADYYDSSTDTLIKSYYLKRVRFYPQLAKNQPEKLVYSPDTTVTIEFSNANKLPNNVLEYRLIRGREKGAWKPTGFILRFDYLKNGTYYQLEMRYAFQPESIKQYYFYIKPSWYQKPWISFMMFASFILIGWVIRRRATLKTKRKHQAIQQKLRIVQSQLNPHFIFNSLSSIQSLMNTNRIDEANEYLSEFSKLMRNTLERSDKIYSPLDKEINTLNTYLKLEQLRFGFSYKIIVENGLNPSEVEVPLLFFQPLIENAVKHGVSGIKNGFINIYFFSSGRKFICKIEDNGRGYNLAQQEFGYGFKLTNDRIKLINEMTRSKTVELNVKSLSGTVIEVVFNDWL